MYDGGSDWMIGGKGNDILYAYDGTRDHLDGGPGTDRCPRRDVTLDVDVLTRISALLGIHQALELLYDEEPDPQRGDRRRVRGAPEGIYVSTAAPAQNFARLWNSAGSD